MRCALIALALAGCIHDEYSCRSDADCDSGAGGRCEADHHCTAFDPTCPSQHRYVPHSTLDSNRCFDDSSALANLCAPGQPPAIASGCAATVCQALPACCATGWSEACVRQAQRTCAPACDTRVAITAQKGATLELWDLRWDGTQLSATSADAAYKTALVWLAPPPGQSDPRRAGFVDAANTFGVETAAGTTTIPLDPTRTYRGASSVDFDRAGHDTVALAYTDALGNSFVELVELDVATPPRELGVPAALNEVWADYDHDAFPDGIAASGAVYTFLVNIDDNLPDHHRALDGSVSAAFSGGQTGSETQSRAFDFSDVDGNGTLDLAAFGNSVHEHLSSDRITDRALFNIDCSPPVLNPAAPPTGCDPTTATFAGAALPTQGAPGLLVISTSPTRGVFEVTVKATSNPPALLSAPLTITPACAGPGCDAILALVTRDLDGDRKLDILAIDGSLHVYLALSTSSTFPTLVDTLQIGTTTTGFGQVHVSVSGAPR
jgi:hypothetical protein